MKLKKQGLFFKEHAGISVIVLIFLILRIAVMFVYFNVGFDDSIYLGQAKYLYSFGATGYFEPLRPLMLPIMLGTGWILGADIVVWGKLLALLFSAASIVLVYAIASKLFNKTAGIASAVFFAITPIYFFFADKILTDIPSTFFALLSLYFFIKKKYWLTGLLASISFMTRFPQGVLLPIYAVVFASMFFQSKSKQKKSVVFNALKFLASFSAVVASYLAFNVFKYSSADSKIEAMFWPFVHGNTTITTSGLWMYAHSWSFYFIELFKQNYILALSAVFIVFYFALKKYRDKNYNFILSAVLIFLAYFIQLEHKELRFAIVFLPYAAIMSGISFAWIYSSIEKNIKFLILFFIVALTILAFAKLPIPSLQEYVEPRADDICRAINSNNLTQPVLLTTPYPIYCLNNKIEMDLYSVPYMWTLIEANPNWTIVYSPQTFVCAPNDKECQDQNRITLNRLQNSFNQIYFNNNTVYSIYVFRK
jgi:hypothetical protein